MRTDDFAYFWPGQSMQPLFTFSQNERLKSRKIISRLFREGNSYVAYPLRVVWLPLAPGEQTAPMSPGVRAQLAISVPKRVFKTAVQRNLLKRRIREAYRLHKLEFYQKLESSDQYIGLMLIVVAKEEVDYKAVEAGVLKMIRKFPG